MNVQIKSTHGDIPGTHILGRPFKPLAVGLIIGSTVLGVDFIIHQLTNTHNLTQYTPFASMFAILGVIGMVGAWIIRSQRVYELSLLLIMGVWCARAIEIFLLGNEANALLPFAISFMAGGAYWLEKITDNNRVQ